MKQVFKSLVIISLLIITSCGKTEDKIPDNALPEKNKPELLGNFADGSYQQRNDGYDWVGASVFERDENSIELKVRSRADKKRPTCTFDATAYRADNGRYLTKIDDHDIIIELDDKELTISTAEPEHEGILYFFCSGGATVAGTYFRIEGDLDPSQIDQTSFSRVLRLQGIGFNVSSIVKDSVNTVTVSPFGLEITNRPETLEIPGHIVTGAEVEDLNSDGSPELLIYTRSNDDHEYGDVISFSVNNRKSMSMVFFPPLEQEPELNNGYEGYDKFSVVENYLGRRFPIYSDGKRTSSVRQIMYELTDGEAMRSFKVKSVTDLGN